ncbi:MAG: FAD-dependent oxidoreductase [Alphaproteobacteria bacterium]|nr:FAD-dependent oxidoreductase [Alphaproteobacteria bacterium]
MTERVIIIGAGIAGLCTALSLTGAGRQLTLLERDPPPPEGGLDAAFHDWRRGGVTHLRHSHAFLARLRGILKARHPRLLARLLDAGVRELPFDGVLSPQLKATYTPAPEDSDLTIITSRRTTLEWLIRDYVQALPDVEIIAGAMMRSLIIDEKTTPWSVRGVRYERDGAHEDIRGDIVVDASGRLGGARDQLIAAGAPIACESEPAGILYYTRHYRLHANQEEPRRGEHPPGNGDLGFLKFGVFPGDNGCFSITLAVPEVELEMRKAIVRPEIFQAVTQQLPGLIPWTDPERAEPVGKVYAMGDLKSIWWEFAPNGAPAVLNYFALGDAHVRTNPLYGRGCSFAAIAGEALRDCLDAHTDPAQRLIAYERALRAALRPFYDNMLQQDRSAIRRAEHALTPGHKSSLRGRILKSFVEDGVAIALRRDLALMRHAMRAFHMLDPPDAWLKQPANLLRVAGHWARGRRANAAFYPPKPGPERADLFAGLGLDAAADLRPAA